MFQNLQEKREFQASQTEALIGNFLASGGKVTVAKQGRKTVKTFSSKGAVFNKGAKSVSLKNSGLYVR